MNTNEPIYEYDSKGNLIYYRNSNCEDCGKEIPTVRLESCPDTKWCVGCVDQHIDRLVGFQIYPHKTGGEVIITSGDENFRRLEREYKRSR